MARDREKWYDSDNPDRVGRALTFRGVLLILLLVAVVAGISISIWAFQVGTSEIKGAGDVKRTNNSAPNRIAAQEKFEKLYADVKAADQRIDTFAQAKQENPDDYTARVNYTGAVSFCGQVVADYNAEARKITSADWRSMDLPEQIDSSDPATDCKPSKETTK